MKKIQIILGIVILAGVYHTANAQLSAAQNLTQVLQNIKTFSAHFDQMIKSDRGKILSHCVGVVNIQRPGRFSWETIKPNALRVVADGQNIWTYDIDLEQIIKQNAKTTMLGSPAALLAGQSVRLEKDFIVQYADHSHENYILHPRVKESMFNEIKIRFKENQLLSMDIKDGLGQSIQTQFTQVKLNTNLNPKIFIFNPPKGVDIINNQKI